MRYLGRATTAIGTTLSIMPGFAESVNQGDEPGESGVIRIPVKRLFPGIERNHWADTVDSVDSLTE
jgi:hypothetical protein